MLSLPMAPQLTLEQRLMIASVRRALGQTSQELDLTSVDWAAFGSEVTRHGLAPLVAVGLPDVGAPPSDVLEKLRAARAVAALRSNAYGKPAMVLALSTLAEAGLEPVVLKGGSLAYQAYPRPDYRTMNDIDLLVNPDELQRAERALLAKGFEPMDVELPHGHHHLPPFRTPNGQFVVELHDRLLPSSSPYKLDTASLIGRAPRCELAGQPARVLSTTDALMHICVHLAYGHRYEWFPLRTLVDILALTLAEPDLDWDEFASRVDDAGAAGSVYWPLHLSRMWLDAPVPDGVLEALAPTRLVRRLVEPILESPFVLDGRAPNEWGAGVLYRAMVDLSLFAGGSIWSQVRAVLRNLFPSPELVGHLPDDFTQSRLRYGAYLGRPVRVARGAHAFAQLLIRVPQRG